MISDNIVVRSEHLSIMFVVPGAILKVGKDFSRTFLSLLHIDIPFSCNNQELSKYLTLH
jgi:hypothetical protein